MSIDFLLNTYAKMIKIGNNIKIGGGSGVVKDIEDNEIVMGYPAEKLRYFLKKNKSNE